MVSDYYRVAPENGPRIVVIGGGHGQSTLLRGLKLYSKNLTAIVAVTDDGGGSGILRRDLGMLPPGDIRNCMEALASAEPIMTRLMSYRFTEGSLAGQSFGNLLLAALNGIMPSFDQAVAGLSQVLAITGRVLPVTNANLRLEAEFENGHMIQGESSICQMKRQEGCRIRQVRLHPDRAKALPEAVEAIREADLILLGPGSLYTSVIPNLLVDGVAQAIAQSDAPKIYVCNIMTQEGESEGYTAADHLEALLAHGCPGLVDLCLANSTPMQPGLVEKYQAEGAAPLVIDRERIAALGLELVERPVAAHHGDFARHDPDKLAEALLEIYRRRAVRIFRGARRYILEE